jgi:protein-L-isoaspartate(D-aspartate) O-methyltransferase
VTITNFLKRLRPCRPNPGPDKTENLSDKREAMVREIEAEARMIAGLEGVPAIAPVVLKAMGKVPRHEFVPPSEQPLAYYNGALPIGHGQTISQPYIVALMTTLLRPAPGDVVLEVGTGSGYQAAVLAEMVHRVYTIEVVEPLAREAKTCLQRLGYDNVETRAGDGYLGWPEHAPYDAIIVTASAKEVPPPLVEQLKPGGRLVIPLRADGLAHDLVIIDKTETGGTRKRSVLPVAFVPLTRGRDGKA